MPNPIQVTSRTYNTIIADIDSDPKLRAKPRWYKRIWAGVGDQLNRMLDAVANLAFLRTAFTRKAVQDLLQLIDYHMAGRDTSSGTQRFNFDPNTSFPVSFDPVDQAAQSPGSFAVNALRFEGRSAIAFSPSSENFTADDSTDELTIAAEYHTGDLVRVSTTGTLPAGLAVSTNYWVIAVTATEIKLATSLENALLGTAIDITDTGSGTHTITSYAAKVTVHQQTSIDYQVVGESDGLSPFQQFDLLDDNILLDQVGLRINSDTSWERKTTLAQSGPTDKHFRAHLKSNGVGFIRFGNGTFGQVPPAADIEAKYAVGGGSNSNVFELYFIDRYAGTRTDIIDTSNITTMTGGDDEESIESAKNLGPELLKTRDRAVTVADFIALSLGFGSINKVQIQSNTPAPLKTTVNIVPNGGGLPASSLKTDLAAFLTERTLMADNGSGLIEVIVADPVYVTPTVVSEFRPAPGFTFAQVKPIYDLAILLFFSEVTEEIITLANTSIADARTFINSKFGTSFSSSDDSNIKTLIDAINSTGTRAFGETIEESDILGYLDVFVPGVDSLNMSSPTFPFELAANEITTITTGDITTTELV